MDGIHCFQDLFPNSKFVHSSVIVSGHECLRLLNNLFYLIKTSFNDESKDERLLGLSKSVDTTFQLIISLLTRHSTC